jgi:hypothetical protein
VLSDPHRGDDDDLVPVAPVEHDQSLSSSAFAFNNILDALGAVGMYTTISE